MNDRRFLALAGGGYLLLLLVWAIRFNGHSLAMMDTLEYAFPEKWVNVQSFQAGQIPLWNPWNACGLPHLGNLQSAVFYPLFWPWNLTGLFDWFFWISLAHGLLAAAGFYFWMRESKVKEALAALSALGFAGSALMVQYWGFPTHLATAAWVPWIFWATSRFQKSPSLERGAWLTLFWSLDFLAGYVYFTFYAALLWAAWVFWVLKPKARQIVSYGAVALAALGVTACQWLPFLDFLKSSFRPGLLDGVYSLHLKDFWTLFSPEILGLPGTLSYRGDYADYIFDNFYLGAVPLGLWLAGWFWGRGTKFGFWNGAGLLTLLWTAGVHSPFSFLLPARVFGWLDPAKAGFLFIFCAFTFIGLWTQPILDRLTQKNKFPLFISFLGALWFLEILTIPFRVIHIIPDPYRALGMIKAAQLVKQEVGPGRIVSLHRDDLAASDPAAGPGASILDRFLGLPPNSNAVWGIPSVGGYFSVFPEGYQNIQSYLTKGFPFDGRVLDAAGADLLLTQDTLTSFKYRALAGWGPYRLNSNAGALAPLWLDYQVSEFPDRAAVFEALLKPDAFLENEIYSEKAADGRAVRLAPASRGLNYDPPGWADRWNGFWQRLGGSDLQADKASPCRVGAEVNLRDPGYVVLSQTFSPGWRAWVDGKPEAIFRADGFLMAVVVDQSGLHRVDFRYEPVSFRLGLFLSLFFVTFLGMAWARARLNRAPKISFLNKW
jgi:hypothetical protein